ncbi:hypothetical protein HY948_05110 [Candidatus Gottesmanbacteria bacterium]|nr:hypothetical protein [Candidatus Gottesmanbacteria bacterium]
MSSWRTGRRLFYLSLVLGFFLVVFLFFYFTIVRKPASCSDNIFNQNELAIDCGGSCAKVCPFEVSPIIKRWTRFFKISDGKYDVAALVENPNFGFGIRSLSYIITLYDRDNSIIVSRSGVTFANPKETFLVFENSLSAGQRVPVKAIIEFVGENVWSRVPAGVVMPKTKIQNMSLVEGVLPHLTAEFINESDLDLTDINLTTVIYDSDDYAMAVSSTYVNYIRRGEAEEVGFTWALPFASKAAVRQIYPRLNIVPAPK